MPTLRLLTTLVAATLLSGAALAQTPVPEDARPAPLATPAAAPSPAPSTSDTTVDPTTGTSVTQTVVANAPIPDTEENRAKFGGPLSNAGKRTPTRGN